MANEKPKTPGEEAAEAQETDVLKLFIIIMALCTFGIGIWGSYKAYALSSITDDISGTVKTIKDIERQIQIREKGPDGEIIIRPNPEKVPLLGKQEERTVRIRSDNLEWYISDRLDKGNYGFQVEQRERLKRTARKGFIEWSLQIRFTSCRVMDVVRFILDVENETRDVRAREVKLLQLQGEGADMTCRATVAFNLWERREKDGK
ncbi:MAG: hypothetical protein ACYS8W_15635 [Planctomycetota bacterium]|jgi:hypothetical protein